MPTPLGKPSRAEHPAALRAIVDFSAKNGGPTDRRQRIDEHYSYASLAVAFLMPLPSDTAPAVEQLVLEGYRRMSPAEKLGRVVALNHALDQLATARLRARYGSQLSDQELRLRLAALRLDASVMADVFGWDPAVHGL
jgi:hypothetical protein